MKIINQSGTSIYNFDNVVFVYVVGNRIKLSLPCPMFNDNDDRQRLPQVVIAEYGDREEAQRMFDKFIAYCGLMGDKGVYQFEGKASKNV